METSSYAGYPGGVAIRNYDDKAIEANTKCVTGGGIGDGFCVYTELLPGENAPDRTSRVIKLSSVTEHEKTYVGDVDGDGISDRFILNLDIEGRGPGRVEFGRADGTYVTEQPSQFRTASGEVLRIGQEVTITHRYDSSRTRDVIDSILVNPDMRKEVGSSPYLLVSVAVYTKRDDYTSIDRCASK